MMRDEISPSERQCVAGYGVIGSTRALAHALELASQQVTVNALCPGWVETQMATRGNAARNRGRRVVVRGAPPAHARCRADRRIIQPEEVPELVEFPTSDGAAAIAGQTCNVRGGQMMD